MRVAIITETFAPDLNGVAHSVVRVAEHLKARGHDLVVIAPEPPDGVPSAFGYPVVRVPSLPMVGYPTFRIGLPSRRVVETLAVFAPDVVHLAAPFAFGAYGLAAAMRMSLPAVALYQTARRVPSWKSSCRTRSARRRVPGGRPRGRSRDPR